MRGSTRGLILGVALAASGCREPSPTSPADRAAQCDSYDRETCLGSERCTLDPPDHAAGQHAYTCRPEAGPCELGLAQTDQAACERRAGCEFDPGQCYCACRGAGRTEVEDGSGPKCACVCGGGSPPRCVPTGTVEQRDQAACVALEREACLASESCTLEATPPGASRCRRETGECERQHVQTDESGCTARPGCRYVAATEDAPPACVPAGGTR